MNYKNKLLLEFNLRNKLVEKAEYQQNIIQKISNIISSSKNPIPFLDDLDEFLNYYDISDNIELDITKIYKKDKNEFPTIN
jgi:hypothetical protein